MVQKVKIQEKVTPMPKHQAMRAQESIKIKLQAFQRSKYLMEVSGKSVCKLYTQSFPHAEMHIGLCVKYLLLSN
jgi:hypothetical protein